MFYPCDPYFTNFENIPSDLQDACLNICLTVLEGQQGSFFSSWSDVLYATNSDSPLLATVDTESQLCTITYTWESPFPLNYKEVTTLLSKQYGKCFVVCTSAL